MASLDARRRRALSPLVKTLLLCGVLSSLVYVGSDIIGAIRYPGYSYAGQAFSELLAIGSPVRSFMLATANVYNLLVVAFGIGVWLAGGGRRWYRATGAMLVLYGVASGAGPYIPMHVRGTSSLLGDLPHILITAANVLGILLFLAVGSRTRGRGFFVYSLLTFAAVVVGGAGAGRQIGAVAAGASSPYLGLIERLNIYAAMLWVAVFSILLLREPASAPAEEPGRAKKVTAFVGTASRRHTYGAVREFLERLEGLGGVETEIVRLSDYRIETCRGCKTCFTNGEERCPLKDDRDVLIGKMLEADGVVFASPNYNFHVSGMMKVFLDRLGFFYHRPAFHGRTFTSIVVQGFHGGGPIVKYLDFAGQRLGFNVVKGSYSTALDPMTDKEIEKRDRALEAHVRRFHERLSGDPYPSPSLFELVGFRMGRQTTAAEAKGSPRDFAYYTGRGWLTSDFWYPVRLGLFKSAVGSVADAVFGRIARKNAEGRPGGPPAAHPFSS